MRFRYMSHERSLDYLASPQHNPASHSLTYFTDLNLEAISHFNHFFLSTLKLHFSIFVNNHTVVD